MPESEVRDDDLIPNTGVTIAAAKEWAGKRKPADLCLELFVRIAQLSAFAAYIGAMHGYDLDGGPLPADLCQRHPSVPSLPPVPGGTDLDRNGG